MRLRRLRQGSVLCALGIAACGAGAQVPVLTQHNDNYRTGANPFEVTLTTANVNPAQFGKIYTRKVDGQLYAQPLYAPQVYMADGLIHNVVYVATEHNSVYAFDADDPAASSPLWIAALGPSWQSREVAQNYFDMLPEIGITGTPVIDLDNYILYVVAKTKELGRLVARLHALDLSGGGELFGGPVEIAASVAGTGEGSVGGQVPFNPVTANQRPGLLLLNGVLYIAFASHGDIPTYHGWILGYDPFSLQQVSAYCTTRNGKEGGIWQGGNGISADENGALYAAVGNGSFSGQTGGQDFGESVLKLDPNDLHVIDWFTPYNYAQLNQTDLDLGTSQVLPIPGTNRLVTGSKEGYIYVLDRGNLGHFRQGGDTQIVQKWKAGNDHIHSLAYWNGPSGGLLYVWPQFDQLKAYRFDAAQGKFQTTPVAVGSLTLQGHPGGILSVSSNAALPGTGILWANTCAADSIHATVNGVLRAYDAVTLQELWNSRQYGGFDELGAYAKFTAPTVADGKVFMASFGGKLAVYGQPQNAPPPAASITTPANRAIWSRGGSLPIRADAWARNDTLSRVDFYADGILIGSKTAPPYEITWNNVPPGVHAIAAAASNSSGLTGSSRPVQLFVPWHALNCGGNGTYHFTNDAYFTGGTAAFSNVAIDVAGVDLPAPVAVYQTERYGPCVYTLPGLTPGAPYRVRLHFAETFFGGPNLRLFNTLINGATVLTNMDIFAAAGAKNRAIVKEFVAWADTNGKITITQQAIKDNPKICGVEIY